MGDRATVQYVNALFGIFTAYRAQEKDRGGWAWFFGGLPFEDAHGAVPKMEAETAKTEAVIQERMARGGDGSLLNPAKDHPPALF